MPKIPVEFHSEAEAELLHAFDWYHVRNTEVAKRFEDEVAALISRLETSPSRFPFLEKPIRIATLRQFPYYIPFRVIADKIEILGVCHASREPGYWKNR
jgi:plasmid stabilization system protein ParE